MTDARAINSIMTYRGAADAWECDQMRHMNVTFICERFSRASTFLFASLGVNPGVAGEGSPVMRLEAERMIFRKEIKPGKPLLIESRLLSGADSETLFVRHEMKFADAGEICGINVARCSGFPPSIASKLVIADRVAGDGEQLDFTEPVIDKQVPLIESGRSCLDAADFMDGDLRREALVRLINHAAACTGLDRGRRWGDHDRLDIGSATLDISIRRLARATPAAPVLLRSGLQARSAKTVTVLHQVLDATTDVVIAEAASTHVFFDMASRASVPVPIEVSSLISQ